MPLPTSVPETDEVAYERVVALASSVKSNLTGVDNLLANGGPVLMDNLIGLYQSLNGAQTAGIAAQGVPGLSDYAKTKLGADYDIDAQFLSSIIACRAVTDWLLAHMPGDGQGQFFGWQHQADGTITRLTLDPSTLAPLAPLIAAALSTFA